MLELNAKAVINFGGIMSDKKEPRLTETVRGSG
jgi:hypothetical protein